MSKKQIWLIYEKDYEGNPKDIVLVTTNFQKVKSFLSDKIDKKDPYKDSEIMREI